MLKPLFGTPLNREHPLAQGLTGCWLLNEGSGNKSYDSSGCGNHGTLSGFSDPPTAGNGWAAGPNGGGLGFDFTGPAQRISFGSSATLYPGYGSLTVEAVVLNTAMAYPRAVLPVGYPQAYWAGSVGWSIDNYSSTGALYIYLNDGTHLAASTVSFARPTGVWQQIVVSYNRSDGYAYAYRDARYLGRVNISTVTGNVVGGNIVCGNLAGWRLDGVLGHLRIWQRALSSAEISQLYAQPYCMFEPDDLVRPRAFEQTPIRRLLCNGM